MLRNAPLPRELNSSLGSERKDFAVKAGRAQPRNKSLAIILFGTFWTAFTSIFVIVFLGPLFAGKEVHFETNGVPTVAGPDNLEPILVPALIIGLFVLIGLGMLFGGFYSMFKKGGYFVGTLSRLILLFLAIPLCFSCQHTKAPDKDSSGDLEVETLIKRRDDGTVSSVNQVDENNRVHGIRATYYQDGSTLYSKHTFNHGRKQGPAIWYYTNGQIFKQSNFEDGKRHGLTRVYYKNGDLSAEFESDHGNVLPGLKEYKRDGTPVSSYPGVTFREIDLRASSNRVDLEISCTKRRSGVKFYILKEENGSTDRIYLITKNDAALLQYYVKPGENLNEKIEILAEIPTELGNVFVKKYSYRLSISD